MRLYMQSAGQHYSSCRAGDYWCDKTGKMWLLLRITPREGWFWHSIDMDELARALGDAHPVLQPNESYGGW